LSTSEKVLWVLEQLGGMKRFVKAGDLVLIKPNLVAPFSAATTDFKIIASVVQEIKQCKAIPILGESAGFEFDTEKTFQFLGIHHFAQDQGIKLLNLDNEKFITIPVTHRLLGKMEISKIALEADVIVNLPKLKNHSLTGVTIGMKNLIGFLSRNSRRRIHAFGLERGIIELNKIIQPALTIVDALSTLSRPVYGKKRELGAIIGGDDVVAVDRFCCQLLGIDWQKVGHLRSTISYEIEVIGDKVEPVTTINFKFPKWLRLSSFKIMYLVDMVYTKLFPGQSLVPIIHFWLGMRPYIDSCRCNSCGECVSSCMMKAIDLTNKRIISERCMHLRCFKCIKACIRGAIKIKKWM
jgi:uncharacterized protein (DUF362 family)/NAD-dependent dihydropyrimidine dehydrogenase PreA subunit